jgi:hypothetical protein
MSVQKSSLLFNRVKQMLVKPRMKSTLVYEVDKTSAQKWLEGRIVKIKETQKFHAVSILSFFFSHLKSIRLNLSLGNGILF